MIVLQLLLYCLLFTAMVKIAVIGGAVNGLYTPEKEAKYPTSSRWILSGSRMRVPVLPHYPLPDLHLHGETRCFRTHAVVLRT